MQPTTAIASEPAPPAKQALRRFVADTLLQLATLDVTHRGEIERTLNSVERLLAVLGQPAPAMRGTLHALLHGGVSRRPELVARLYRELWVLFLASPLEG
jgi:hypothetical protein